MLRRTIAVLSLLCLAAGPATQPKKTPPKPDPNSTEFVLPTLHCRFRVPKTWERKELNAHEPEGLFVFDPAPASKKPKRFLQMIQIDIDRPKVSQKTLADIVNDLRTALQAKGPIKFTKDSAIKFAGHDAWTLQWVEQTPATIIINGKQSQSTMETERSTIAWLDNGMLCNFSMYADPGFLPSLTQKAEGVAKTIQWEE